MTPTLVTVRPGPRRRPARGRIHERATYAASWTPRASGLATLDMRFGAHVKRISASGDEVGTEHRPKSRLVVAETGVRLIVAPRDLARDDLAVVEVVVPRPLTLEVRVVAGEAPVDTTEVWVMRSGGGR